MLVNTHLFSPVVRDGVPPEDSMYYESFYEEVVKYIHNGYSVGGTRITGDHFWYLNFWKIRGLDHNLGRKRIIAPRFIELDYKYYNHLETCRKESKNMCVLKRRQVGMTEKHSALGGKEFSFYPGSQVVYVAGLDFYTNQLLTNTRRGLDDLFNTEFYKRRQPDRFDYFMASYVDYVENEDGKKTAVTKGFLSEIYGITAKNNPQAVSSRSPSLIIFEEAGIFPGLRQAYRFVKPSLYAEGKKVGLAIIVGTGGQMEKGADELEYVFYNPDEFDMLSFDLSEFDDDIEPGTKRVGYFIPDWSFYKIDKDGNDLKEESIAELDKARIDAEGTDSYNELVITMPRKPSDAFLLPQGGYFGKDTAGRLNKTRSNILTHAELMDKKRTGRLEWIKEGKLILGVEFIDDPFEGDVEIYEMPLTLNDSGKVVDYDPGLNVPFGLYKQGTDSYDKDQALNSESKGASIIRKRFFNADHTANLWAAKCFMRAENAYKFFENTAKMAWMYNTQNLVEWSNILIFDWYKRNDLEHLLRLRPDLAISKWINNPSVDNRYGIDPSSKREWLKLLKQLLKEPGECERMLDLDMIRAFINFRLEPGYNCDLTITSSLCAVQLYEDDLEDQQGQEKKSSGPMYGYRKVNGKIIRVSR